MRVCRFLEAIGTHSETEMVDMPQVFLPCAADAKDRRCMNRLYSLSVCWGNGKETPESPDPPERGSGPAQRKTFHAVKVNHNERREFKGNKIILQWCVKLPNAYRMWEGIIGSNEESGNNGMFGTYFESFTLHGDGE